MGQKSPPKRAPYDSKIHEYLLDKTLVILPEYIENKFNVFGVSVNIPGAGICLKSYPTNKVYP